MAAQYIQVPCPECNRNISQYALMCPGCGRKIYEKSRGAFFNILIVFFLIGGLVTFLVGRKTWRDMKSKIRSANDVARNLQVEKAIDQQSISELQEKLKKATSEIDDFVGEQKKWKERSSKAVATEVKKRRDVREKLAVAVLIQLGQTNKIFKLKNLGQTIPPRYAYDLKELRKHRLIGEKLAGGEKYGYKYKVWPVKKGRGFHATAIPTKEDYPSFFLDHEGNVRVEESGKTPTEESSLYEE